MSAIHAKAARRCVIPNVARVGFYEGKGAPEDDLLPSCVKAILQLRGEDLGFLSRPGAMDPWHDLHCYLLGMSGCGFRFACHPTKRSAADGSPWLVHEDPVESARRALGAAGYSCEASVRPAFVKEHGGQADPKATEGAWRQRIVESIRDRGMPVIAIGVIGPPEPCLITGYDEDGDVLIGWNAFQGMPEFAKGVTFEKNGCFCKRDWFKDTPGLIFVGERLPGAPAPKTAGGYRDALVNGLSIMRGPRVKDRLTGQAAFSHWADRLLDDRLFPAKIPKLLNERFFVHHERGGVLAEARAYCASFLRFAAEAHPEAASELTEAAACFDDEHDLVWAIREFTGGMVTSDEGARQFARADIRGRIVPLIRLARRRDADAASHIEQAIRKIDDAARGASLPFGASLPLVTPNSKATVTRESGSARIEGVPGVVWGAGRDCAFLGSLKAATSVSERPCDYADMMGATGIAFRVRWSNPDTIGGWDHSSAGGEFMEEWDDVQRATGWNLTAEFPGITQDPATDPNAQRVRRHIDAGWPVMAAVAGPDIGVIVGYSDEGRRMTIRRYGDTEPREVRAEEACGSFQLFLDACEPVPDPRRVLAAGLRTALRNWKRGKASAGYAPHGREWFYGEQAMRIWADDLLMRDPASVNPKDGQVYRDVNRFVYLSLLDARKAAVIFLRRHAGLLSGDGKAAMLRAADAYEREVGLLSGPVTGNAPWLKNGTAEWTTEDRRAQSEIILSALKLEQEAMASLATAAHALEATPPAMRSYDLGHRALLPGAPKVGYGVRLCPFPGSMESALRYIGDPVDYDFINATSGASFRRFWEQDDGGNVDLMYLGEEPIRRLFAALNRDVTIVPGYDRDAMLRAIKESIGRGRPVVAFGIIGPPEAGLVTGYDRGGDVLMGWSYFQEGAAPGYYQQSDWHARANWAGGMGCVVIGDKKRWPGPSKRETLLATLKWAIDLSRMASRPEVKGHVAGLAAYDAWADALEEDADYPPDNEGVMHTRVMVHGDQCCMLEDRRSAAGFLRAMAKEAPEAKAHLLAAADLYEQAARAQLWPRGHDMGEAARAGLRIRLPAASSPPKCARPTTPRLRPSPSLSRQSR